MFVSFCDSKFCPLANSSQYHDDGEISLGLTVASLSLGCPAKMKWRMKMKYWCGLKGKDHNRYDPKLPILPGCRMPEKRHELNELAKTVSATELDAAAEIALAFEKGESRTPPVIIDMELRHGDYMVMHGASMQIYYEVCVLGNSFIDWRLTNYSTWSPLPTSCASASHAVTSSLRWSPKICALWETLLSIRRTPMTVMSSSTMITWRRLRRSARKECLRRALLLLLQLRHEHVVEDFFAIYEKEMLMHAISFFANLRITIEL